MSNLSEHIKRKIWERDHYRCQECGIRVGRDGGLRPHTHHLVPKSLGGGDDVTNLTTLCQPCHTMKRNHTFMLDGTQVKDFPQYIKWSLWAISLNLLAYANKLDPQNFPSPQQVIEYIKKIQDGLEGVIPLIVDCEQKGIGKGELIFDEDLIKEAQQYENVIKGIRIGWMSHYHQRALDQIIIES
ncbi:HNH endonuclease [Candidatus Neomarinimicrobiota bacterium]